MTLKVVTRTHNNKMRLTNVVYQANLNVKIDLSCLVHQLTMCVTILAYSLDLYIRIEKSVGTV